MKTKRPKVDEHDFEALDKLAHSITLAKLRPLTPAQQRMWEEAKRGRPKKAPGTKAVPTMITVEPKLLKKVDAYARRQGMSRSQLFAEAVQKRMAG